MNDFLDNFIRNLGNWTDFTRNNYNGQGGSYGDIQAALRDYVALVFDASASQIDNFTKSKGI